MLRDDKWMSVTVLYRSQYYLATVSHIYIAYDYVRNVWEYFVEH